MGLVTNVIVGGIKGAGRMAYGATSVAAGATVTATKTVVRQTGMVGKTAAYAGMGFGRLFQKVPKTAFNPFGYGIKHPYMLTAGIAAGSLSYGFGKGATASNYMTGEFAYAGPAPQFMYDYSKNIDKLMMAQQGMPNAANTMGADGDLVLALAQNKGRQL